MRYSFVLTGEGVDAAGVSCKRTDIVDVLESHGHTVSGAVTRGINYLVASRADTKKATDAAKKGVQTITYKEMWDLVNWDMTPVSTLQFATQPAPAMDQVSVAEQLKDNPLFGSF